MSVNPSSLRARRYSTARYTVDLTAVNGFSSPVSLSVSGLPYGASAWFSPNSLTPSGSSTLSVWTGRAVGTYTLTITASGGGVIQSTTVTLTVSWF
jgi:hypothetical protein